MSTILHSFSAGIAFAFGSLVGIFIAAYMTRRRDQRLMEHVHDVNIEIRERLTKQVDALNRIADTLEKR